MEQIGNTLKRTVGDNIKFYRKEKDLTQEAFSEMIGITSTTLSKIENGETDIRMDLLESISKKLDIPIQKLIFSQDVIILSKEAVENLQKIT